MSSSDSPPLKFGERLSTSPGTTSDRRGTPPITTATSAVDQATAQLEPVADAPAPESHPETLAEWAEFHEAIETHYRTTNEKSFSLVWYGGVTQRDACELLGVSERTVLRRFHRARLLLAKRVGAFVRLQTESQADMVDEQKLGDLLIEWDEQRQVRETSPRAEATLSATIPDLVSELASRIEALKTDRLAVQRRHRLRTAPFYHFPKLPEDDSVVRINVRLPDSTLTADELAVAIQQMRVCWTKGRPRSRSQRTSLQDHSAGDLAHELIRRQHLTDLPGLRRCSSGKQLPLVLGDYEILDRIGAGGMGEVFKARHRRMKRVVALKILPQRN